VFKNNLLANICIIFLKCFGGNIVKTMCIKCSEIINIFQLLCGILSTYTTYVYHNSNSCDVLMVIFYRELIRSLYFYPVTESVVCHKWIKLFSSCKKYVFPCWIFQLVMDVLRAIRTAIYVYNKHNNNISPTLYYVKNTVWLALVSIQAYA